MTNFVALSGKLAGEPKPFPGASGKGPTTVRISNAKRVKQADGEFKYDPQYFNVIVFGDDRVIANSVTKGDTVHVTGRLQWREYTDKSDNKREQIEILCDTFLVVVGEPNAYSNGESQITGTNTAKEAEKGWQF